MQFQKVSIILWVALAFWFIERCQGEEAKAEEAVQKADENRAEPSKLKQPARAIDSGERPTGYAGGRRRVPDPSSDFVVIPDRWRMPFPRWDRHPGRKGEAPYTRGSIYNPYYQNVLKGDYPVIGDDKFFVLTAISDTIFETRKVPTPSGISTRQAFRESFFADPEQNFINENIILSLELFQGATAFRPRDWELRFTPVFNVNHLNLHENNGIDIDVREGDNRTDTHFGIQELFFEKHVGDLTHFYDFFAFRGGIQAFTSDFRGFLFLENQPGGRIVGSWHNNLWNYNLAYFRFIEKDTNSGLNEVFNDRKQDVIIANLFRQDFIWKGYTLQVSYHFNYDHGDGHFDDNRFLRRPAPIGDRGAKQVRAHYLGINGEGHIGRLNISHAYYFAFGEESHNPIAQQEVDIRAHMVAVEPSIDFDWLRLKASFFYASGDKDPEDDLAEGFDTIVDNPNFGGAGASYWQRQGIPFGDTAVFLKGRNSLLPNLRAAKNEGQANFVNPGLLLAGAGIDIRLTQKLRTELNANYIMFDRPQSIELLLFQGQVNRPIGVDYNLGIQYRPQLTDNVIITAGAAIFQPLEGFGDIYESQATLYSIFLGVTLVY